MIPALDLRLNPAYAGLRRNPFILGATIELQVQFHNHRQYISLSIEALSHFHIEQLTQIS